LGLNLNWEADLWGRLTDQTRAAYLDAKAADIDYAASQLSIAGATVQSFYAVTEAMLQRQLSERDVQTGEANLRIIERRYARGISRSLDVRLARSSLASSRATLLTRQQAELEAIRRLEVLLGRYPAAELLADNDLPRLPAIIDGEGKLIGLGTPEGLLFRRPDILADEQQLKAAGLRVAAARKAFLPSLSLRGFAQESGTGIEDLLDIDEVFAQLVASLVQPLFQGGRLMAQAGQQKALMEASLYTYAQTVLLAYEEVENAIAAERLLTAQAEAQRIAFDEAAAAEELTNRQYVQGTTDIFNLINAQQRRITAESQFIAASRGQLTNRINLYLALGTPFQVPDPEEPEEDAVQLSSHRPLSVSKGDI
ncbi:MAG: TolC family protein, partial [Pseudomonadota bacterium]